MQPMTQSSTEAASSGQMMQQVTQNAGEATSRLGLTAPDRRLSRSLTQTGQARAESGRGGEDAQHDRAGLRARRDEDAQPGHERGADGKSTAAGLGGADGGRGEAETKETQRDRQDGERGHEQRQSERRALQE